MSLYASMLHLNRRDVKALRITDLYSLHRVVYSAFEDVRNEQQKQSGKSSGILFSDQGGDFSGRKVLLLSSRPPLERIDGEYGTIRTKKIPDAFLSSSVYSFKVIVNPTKRNNRTRKLEPIKGREEILQWFSQRAKSSWGFEVSEERSQVDRVEVMQFQHSKKGKVTIAQAHVKGMLKVVDQESFAKSFSDGIGRARSFGCGLLQLVPVSN